MIGCRGSDCGNRGSAGGDSIRDDGVFTDAVAADRPAPVVAVADIAAAGLLLERFWTGVGSVPPLPHRNQRLPPRPQLICEHRVRHDTSVDHVPRNPIRRADSFWTHL